jgi:hypothetical protein
VTSSPGIGRLDFVYMPSRDVAADLSLYEEQLGAEVVFAIEAFGTRVAMIRFGEEPPALLLAGHLEGDQPVLMHRVENLGEATRMLESRGAELGEPFELPPGRAAEILLPGPQRLAIYELTRPGRAETLGGRRDF